MKSRFLLAILLSLGLGVGTVHARTPVPIVNYENNPVATNSGKPMTADKVKQAILAAASSKQWSIAYQPNGKMQATLVMKGKHTIVVEVAYTAENYSLTYLSSDNMKYGEVEGVPVIHPYYDRWVREFREAIRTELIKY